MFVERVLKISEDILFGTNSERREAFWVCGTKHHMGSDIMRREEYSLLKDFKLEVEAKDETFTLCFWLYLMSSSKFPTTILQQVHSDTHNSVPFFVIDEKKRMILLPLLWLHDEASDQGKFSSWKDVLHACRDFELHVQEWVHIGCEVSLGYMRVYINGKIFGERILSSSPTKVSSSSFLKKITLTGINGESNSMEAYIHDVEILPWGSSLKDHHGKNPPVSLLIDNSSTFEIEEDNDGVWSIVGGKASCRRIFSLDVILSNVFGQTINKETEVVASLFYADNGTPVENTTDAEAPLLVVYDGIEFPSSERPTALLQGRASFKLKISQLSSKCDNRLFHIKFHIPQFEVYPFFEARSPSIRCISRSRNTRVSTLVWKRSTTSLPQNSLSQSLIVDADSEAQEESMFETKSNPLLKRFRLGHDKIAVAMKAHPRLEPFNEEFNSHAWITDQVENGLAISSKDRPEKFDEVDKFPESECTGDRRSNSKSMCHKHNPVSDMTIFKYCLAGFNERSLMLREIVTSASESEILELARQVSLYSGCSHHWNQIIIAKKLVEEGTKAWNNISQNTNPVLWESAVLEIQAQFMKISGCSSRKLTKQDFELLRRIAGCQDFMDQENFEKMWCWLYPVASTISRDWIKTIWSSTSPKWIEGFITKEEAESSLQGAWGFQEPGTFFLRFPTSRSWPHPDAGTLIVTYVGSDCNIHHRLLAIDRLYGSGEKEIDTKLLQDMLLAEPELSRLGRIIRSH